MKRILLVIMAVAGLYTANGQRVERAIGLRLGNGSSAASTEVSYQHPLSKKTRIELDGSLSFGDNWISVGATGLHQWVWNIENGFQWFLGVGATIGETSVSYYTYDNIGRKQSSTNSYNYFTLALNPNGGAEYFFRNIPLQVGIDVRPNINLLHLNESYGLTIFDPTIGFSARYVFK